MNIRRRWFRFAAALSIAAFAGCAESPSSPLAPDDDRTAIAGSDLRLVAQLLPVTQTTSQRLIGPEGGTLHIAGGHALHFPAGAVAEPTSITAVRDPLRLMIHFGPSGLTFPDDARPTLVYHTRSGGLPPHLDPHNLDIVYLDGLRLLEVLPTTFDEQTGVIQADLKHFSTYALATD